MRTLYLFRSLPLLLFFPIVLGLAGCGEEEATLEIQTLLIHHDTLEIGDSTSVSATVNYTGENTLVYTWTATGGDIVGGNSHTVSYTAPSETGTYTIKVTLTDGTLEAIRADQVEVVAVGAIAPEGMVFIPAGEFEMGSAAPEAEPDEKPVHTVYLDAFYLDMHEVTVGEYNAFVAATGHRGLPGWVDGASPSGKHPVVGVSWHDAMAYAVWTGKRLPTEAEWEKAARGGLVGKKYPWGDAAPDGTQCNFADKNLPGGNPDVHAVDDGYRYSAPVWSYPPNGYGLYNMAGNVAEWCLDEYDGDFYASSPRENPLSGGVNITDIISDFTSVATSRVVRGGSWGSTTTDVRSANRGRTAPLNTSSDYGFRCAMAVSP